LPDGQKSLGLGVIKKLTEPLSASMLLEQMRQIQN
jgi:hypothetical protein